MKKILVLVLLASVSIAQWQCKQSNKQEINTSVLADEDAQLIRFKVSGLDDKAVSDSIWRMIFTINGIDQISITELDSTVIFRVDKNLVKADILKNEVEKRGGSVLAN